MERQCECDCIPLLTVGWTSDSATQKQIKTYEQQTLTEIFMKKMNHIRMYTLYLIQLLINKPYSGKNLLFFFKIYNNYVIM